VQKEICESNISDFTYDILESIKFVENCIDFQVLLYAFIIHLLNVNIKCILAAKFKVYAYF
jgi:hypothetical protein